MLRKLVQSQWFPLADLILVLFSGMVGVVRPDIGPWIVLTALLPWVIRILAGRFPFQRTSLDWLIAVFLITAWVGFWASYDRTAAWNKIWYIVLAILLYYSLRAQPHQNRVLISFLFFGMGVGIAFYYFLTHDFVAAPRKLEFVNQIGYWLMRIRPQTGWTAIHPNYVAGMVAVTVPFVFYPVWKYKQENKRFPVLGIVLVLLGLALAALSLVLATSRGVVLAILSAVGTGGLWWLLSFARFKRWNRVIFPVVLLLYLCTVIALLYMGPAQLAGVVAGDSKYGNGSRAELFLNSVYLVGDFPLTGGGLGSFPGLFSHYWLNIPFYYLPNSHNLFLDVALEQGIIGGLSFLCMFIAGLWSVSGSIAVGRGEAAFQWTLLFSLVVAMIHGMVDNYLYNGIGSILSLFLVGLAMNGVQDEGTYAWTGLHPGSTAMLAVFLLVALLVYLKPIHSMWYANLGAVHLAKSELAGFPANQWADTSTVPDLEAANDSFRSALELDPVNRTANHRLGMIAMLRGDFESAAGYLEAARKQAPGHRGIVKALGYCYAWLGDVDRAQVLLVRIPEAKNELEAYTWWWDTQGRNDLSENAFQMISRLNRTIHQP